MGRKKSAKKRSHVNRKQQVSLTPDKGTTVQRTYKDSLFRFIFKDKQKLLKLYNALNGTDHRDIDSLSVTTIENVLYIGYKNDVSFLLDNTLNLYEHQGSWNPNMPLRAGECCILQGFCRIIQRPANLTFTEVKEFRWEQCRPLWDYAVFIHYIRNSLLDGYSVQDAVDLAVERCLKEDILTDVLRAHRKEVTAMFLEEYDQEQHYKTLRDEGYEDGFEDGFDNGLEKFRALSDKLVENNRKDDIIRAATDRDFQKKLFKEYGL